MAFNYTKEDFSTSTPYEQILAISDPFQREIATNALAAYAKTVGIGASGFKRMLKTYIEAQSMRDRMVYVDRGTEFTGQPLELDSGEWDANDFGISRQGRFGEDVACPHPILPVERLVNIDTGMEKLKLAFCKGDRRWREIVVEKKVLASDRAILNLADMGVAVTSGNARALVQYISDLENLNYDLIPESKSVSRLGYIDGEGFSPYVPGLIFDGDLKYRHIFNSIKPNGSCEKWMRHVIALRKEGSIEARIILAASFASVLVEPCGGLPFFVHIWSSDSGTGKTVATMLAASVWGDPVKGRYMQSFNTTMVGQEKLAAFLNHLPMIVDELQLAKDNRGKLNFNVYALAEGVGRTRGTKEGSIDRTATWSNCIITNGESPITGMSAGAGALNRVIDLECSSGKKVIEDGPGTANLVRKNYGFAGRAFVEKLYSDENLERAETLHRKHFKALSDCDATEKQAIAAALILTADELATEWIFKDNRAVTQDEIGDFLMSQDAVSVGRRGYEFFCDWVAQNANKLRDGVEQGEVYGLLEGKRAYIIRGVFNRVAEDNGYPSKALLSYLKDRRLIEARGRAYTKGKRVNGILSECVYLLLEGPEFDEDDDLPF